MNHIFEIILKNKHIKIILLATILTGPIYGQSFDTLLNELVGAGSETEQLESEMTSPQQEKDQSSLPPASTELTAPPEDDDFAPEKNIITNGVTLQGLDKQTARVFIIDAAIGQPIEFGTLKIVVHRCERTPLEDRQDSMAFVTITEAKPNHAGEPLFSGWMFASSPSLSALDHPTYDIWIKGCKMLDHQ